MSSTHLPKTGVARLTLSINGSEYVVVAVPHEKRRAGVVRAWRLRREGTSRLVERWDDGVVTCDCKDSQYRNPCNCKHVRACRAVGII